MPPSQTLTTEVLTEPHATIVRLKGEARLLVDTLERDLQRVMLARPALVLMDLSGFSFCSSLGMGALVSFRRGLVQRGGKVVLCALQPGVLEAFKRARLHDLFQISPTVEDAAALATPAPAPAPPVA